MKGRECKDKMRAAINKKRVKKGVNEKITGITGRELRDKRRRRTDRRSSVKC